MSRRKPKPKREPWPPGTVLEWIEPKPHHKIRTFIVFHDDGSDRLLVTGSDPTVRWPELAAKLKPIDLPEPP